MLALDEFDAIAPRILCVETTRAGNRVIVDDGDAAGRQGFAQFIEIRDFEGGMRFLGRREISLDADVHLPIAALKPASAACAQHRRLFDFLHAEERAVKFARRGLASFGRGDLNVIDSGDARFHFGLAAERAGVAGCTPSAVTTTGCRNAIMPRRRAPTCSISSFCSSARWALNFARPVSFSLIHSRAKFPSVMFFRISRMA